MTLLGVTRATTESLGGIGPSVWPGIGNIHIHTPLDIYVGAQSRSTIDRDLTAVQTRSGDFTGPVHTYEVKVT